MRAKHKLQRRHCLGAEKLGDIFGADQRVVMVEKWIERETLELVAQEHR